MSDFDQALQVVIEGLASIQKTASRPPHATLESLQRLVAAIQSQPPPTGADAASVSTAGKLRVVFVMEARVSEPELEAEVTNLTAKIIGAMRLPDFSFRTISFLPDQDEGTLSDQVASLQPEVVVAMGSSALKVLMGIDGALKSLRGKWHPLGKVPVMATYHPAYLVRNKTMAAKRTVWEDLLQVMERLKLPISAKQRGFFAPK